MRMGILLYLRPRDWTERLHRPEITGNHLSFDNMGRPTDVMDQDGCANNYTYYTSGSKNHKLDKEGKVQKTVCHLLKNPLFDSAYGDGNWYQKNLTNGTRSSIAKAEGYAGTKSAKLTKTGAESEKESVRM